MASMRDIKRRKESIQNTGQITKAMKLTATVKLQKARVRAEEAKPYFDHMYSAVHAMLQRSGTLKHPFLNAGGSDKKAVVLITSNKGLAGGYNANAIKLVTGSGFKKEDILLYTVGRKGREALQRKGYEVKKDYSDVMNAPVYKDAAEIGGAVLDTFSKNEAGEIYLVYTVFENTVSHIPVLLKLLPIETGEDASKDGYDKLTMMNYEPDAEEALDIIIPKYINSLIYGGLMQSLASENGARMQAMDSATSNAQEIIEELSLLYNRARQGSITQELTEIIAGANAIG